MKSLRLYLQLEGPPSRLLPSTPIEKHFVAVRASAHSLRRCYLFHWLLAASKHRDYSLVAFPPGTEHREKNADSRLLHFDSNEQQPHPRPDDHLLPQAPDQAPCSNEPSFPPSPPP